MGVKRFSKKTRAPVTITHSVFLALALSHLLLLGSYIYLNYIQMRVGKLILLLIVCIGCYLVGEALVSYLPESLPAPILYLKIILLRVGNAAVVVLWLISQYLFEDRDARKPISGWVWAIAATGIALQAVASYNFNFRVQTSELAYLLTWGVSQAILLGFVIAALYSALKGYMSDLVVVRRPSRIAFLFVVAFFLLAILSNRGYWIVASSLALESQSQPIPGAAEPTYVYLIVLLLLLWNFRVRSKSTGVSGQDYISSLMEEFSIPTSNKGDAKVIESIRSAMESDKLEPDLTVARLARHVSCPEYKVRRAINNQLGFRNFRNFLGHYRLAESALRLTSTETSISQIGGDVGYISLSSFHTAFKEKFGLTPKEYRIKFMIPDSIVRPDKLHRSTASFACQHDGCRVKTSTFLPICCQRPI